MAAHKDDDLDLLPSQETEHESQTTKPTNPPQRRLVWKNVLLLSLLHLFGFYGLAQLRVARWETIMWAITTLLGSVFSITAGAHRLFAHRSYKATFPLRLVLIILTTMAGQGDMYEWSRNHRAHHKFSETDADPHDARRGFFFSHMGWIVVRKHPEVKRRGKTLNFSDLERDHLIMFQRKYYLPVFFLLNTIIPTVVPVYFWNECYRVSFGLNMLRYMVMQHGIWTVNSFAHIYGYKPYDKNINPTECIIPNLLPTGEGWHNYHHCFPYDYRASEWGWQLNITCVLIDLWAWMGLVYDRKVANQRTIDAKKARTGMKINNVWQKCGIISG